MYIENFKQFIGKQINYNISEKEIQILGKINKIYSFDIEDNDPVINQIKELNNNVYTLRFKVPFSRYTTEYSGNRMNFIINERGTITDICLG